ncbi:MAG: DNA repair protein RecO [Candidatus Portnoybacteria bacterium CG_4_10_14_0_2_um_filter_43_36]|uniref:DNA repair protein RecO n=3 Tax=Candidatus Portnoyibacteriota TaxID=1817913 RepID=A0A2M7YM34_9BACT|nr:MAG: DNA repair protein RecO [Candidatus Portnoybacteria bacterium CG23_combo_of_CG06-09_8_20_14_all_44_36]PIZ69194.1 MAG: DNA repair protein RecO [Candidatus Portnoybacteria bacterium CG_4_10_14_0_2_um_filter_43_36]PJA64043.1 MAG: DNA repair protein RecO [Candidatus Portnoybacteria bacterium CG_4_9_14_3_um_filter_43_11]PJE59474.1 MAG: DNA repair protein RecO [Candidatus Portnoybacteria bacterium CG10_big_fil_rev_8_21_14_0_10_43_39]
MLYKTRGIIIRRSNANDFDRLLTVYTKEFGKVLLKAKSVRKNESKLKGHLELFLYSRLMVAPARRTGKQTRSFDIVAGAETIENFSKLRQNISSLAAAYYLSEITDKLVAGPEKDGDIWNLLLGGFNQLNKGEDAQKTIGNFENKILEHLGYGQQKNPADFIEAILNERIKSKMFLSGIVNNFS